MSEPPHMPAEAQRWKKEFENCLRCGSTKTAESRVRWFDLWRTPFSRKRPYRCFDCYRRFWASPPSTRRDFA